MTQFQAPGETLGDLNADAAARLAAAAGDIAMVIDSAGVIRDLSCVSDDLPADWYEPWRGRLWIETVTADSRPKIEALLREAAERTTPRKRHVNHPLPRGVDLPILYSVVSAGPAGSVVAIGRDLRPMAALQQRVIEAQQSMERDYSRLHHAETRYRLLFQITAEAVLVVDPSGLKVIEANPAAGRLLGETVRRVVGRPFLDAIHSGAAPAVQALLATVRATGEPGSASAHLADEARAVQVETALFRQGSASLFLVRLIPPHVDGDGGAVMPAHSSLLKVIESAPDGLVVTTPDGRILSANAAFLDLAQLATEAQASGQSLERWLGRPGVDLNVLIANLRQHGAVRLFATTLRGEFGATAEIEVSAVSVVDAEQPCFGFTIRNVGRRLNAESRVARALPRSVEQLTELVGRVPLRDLVRETSDVIERLCIEAALELTGDNRASAAEILGLSRQSLYVKLRRYGLGDLTGEVEG